MEKTFGREKAKRYIVMFIVGVFLILISNIVQSVGDAIGNPVLSYIGVLSFVGLILQIIAIILLRNVNKRYANALWMLILNLILFAVAFTLNIIEAVRNEPELFTTALSWIGIGQELTEALVVIYFVLGTNQLAEEDGKGMPILTKLIVRGYVAIFLVSLLLTLLTLFIPAIKENQIATLIFAIILLVLYVVREVAYLFFLIKSLWRVK